MSSALSLGTAVRSWPGRSCSVQVLLLLPPPHLHTHMFSTLHYVQHYLLRLVSICWTKTVWNYLLDFGRTWDFRQRFPVVCLTKISDCVWLNSSVVSALGIRTLGPRFDSRVSPLFHWVATLGKLFTHIASAVSQLPAPRNWGTKGSFRRLSGCGD